MFTVFAFADGNEGGEPPAGEETPEEKKPVIVYNRDYADGWGPYNGAGNPDSFVKGHNFHIDYEMTPDFRYNYFVRMESSSKEDGFLNLTMAMAGNPAKDKIYIEFDIKADDYVHVGSILYSRFVGSGTDHDALTLLSITENTLFPFDNNYRNEGKKVLLQGQWVSVRIEYDYTNDALLAEGKVPVTITLESEGNVIVATKEAKTGKKENVALGLDFIRMGFPTTDDAGAAAREGMSYCFDNMRMYCGVTEPLTETDWIGVGYGLAVDEKAVKTENIAGADQEMTVTDHLNSALIMKVGVDYALLNNKKILLSELENEYADLVCAEPAEDKDGNVLVPLAAILTYIGYPLYVHKDGQSIDISTGNSATYITLGRNTATVSGQTVYLDFAPAMYNNPDTGTSYLVVSVNDVEKLFPGYYVTYDNMGLIIICREDELINRDDNLSLMLDIMKSFIFDEVTAEVVYNDVYENTKNENGTPFSHPFLYGDQSLFDKLIAIYDGTDTTAYDLDIRTALTNQVNRAFSLYELFAMPSSEVVRVYKYQSVSVEYATHGYYGGQYLPLVDGDGRILLADGTYALCEEGRYNYEGLQYVPAENGKYVLTVEGEYLEAMKGRYTPAIDTVTGEHRFEYDGNYDEWVGVDWNSTTARRLIQPYGDTGGYDIGGRIGDAAEVLSYAYDIAFGYIITGDIKLAKCAYAIMSEVGEWDHWGPGHFLNVGDAAANYAPALDWIYNGIKEIETGDANGDGYFNYEDGEWSVSYLQDILYEKGVYEGYLASMKLPTSWPRPAKHGGDVRYYTTMSNNWNAVCASGMILAGMMLFENEKYSDTSAWLVADNITGLAEHGLDQYAPDGSYVEGAGYWGYGTNSLFRGMMGLWRAAGEDYGLLDTWGIDTTCYFACFVQSSEMRAFSFHDAFPGTSTDSCSFMFMAEALGDSNLSEIRKTHLAGSTWMNIKDFLFYPYEADANSEAGAAEELPFDYFMEGIDGYTTRSSWDRGALFAGIIGGDNSASHGQTDSGTFVYENEGIEWITDIGRENTYNVYNYFTTPDRYRYYVNNAEGNNTLALITQNEDVPHGQKLSGFGEMFKTYSNRHGSYALIDNVSAYGGYATSAYRGMLLTNSRRTLVIQDEVQIAGSNTFAWCAHFDNTEIKHELSGDGRTLYLYTENEYGKKIHELRMSIVSVQTNITFELTDCYDFLLTGGEKSTASPEWTLQNGGQPESSRNHYTRIVIKSDGLSFNTAVVFEMMDLTADNGGRDAAVGYEFADMVTWEPIAAFDGGNGGAGSGEEAPKRPAASRNDFGANVNRAKNLFADGTAFTTKFAEFYRSLTDVYYIYTTLEQQLQDDRYKDSVAGYMALRESFQAFRNAVVSIASGKDAITGKLMGF